MAGQFSTPLRDERRRAGWRKHITPLMPPIGRHVFQLLLYRLVKPAIIRFLDACAREIDNNFDCAGGPMATS